VFLKDFWYEVGGDPVTVSVPRSAEFPLVLLVLVFAAQDQHQGSHDGQVVYQKVNFASGTGGWQYPRPLDEHFTEVVGVSNDAPPSGDEKFLAVSSTDCFQIFDGRCGRVFVELASLCLGCPEYDVADCVDESDSKQVVPFHNRVSLNEVLRDESWDEGEGQVGAD